MHKEKIHKQLNCLWILNIGRGGRNRTHVKGFGDPYSTIEPHPYEWCAIRDSNPGPTGYEPVALTN